MEQHVYLKVLDQAIEVVESQAVPYGLIGGIASAVQGRARWSEDIDIFVRPQDARPLLERFGRRGFETQETNPAWIYKAFSDGVVIDIIFRSEGDIYLDDEMEHRIREGEFFGRRVKLVPPEDVLVMKAVAHSEETPRYWHDALGIVAHSDLDWDYLIQRARQHGARRVLSLLMYAQSNDLVVPEHVVNSLFHMVRA